MKHAYLILAHGSYPLLQRLISAIDDPRNDIYVHIDRKIQRLPTFVVEHSQLHMLDAERVSVSWGDVSVVEAEFALMEVALRSGTYEYYHLLSGVDLPLKNQDYIHTFCQANRGKEFIGFYSGADLESSLRRKVQRYHFFPHSFRGTGLLFLGKRIIRALALKMQELLGITRHKNISFAKGTQWWSLTEELISALVDNRDSILPMYHHTFCPDEIAIQTYVLSSPFMERVYDPSQEGLSCMRHIGWRDGVLYDFESKDYEELAGSNALFARKFNLQDEAFLQRVSQLSE